MVITTGEESVETGTNIRIQVATSSPQSYVGLRAIDKSVLLLRSGNDITNQRVRTELPQILTLLVKSDVYL